MFKTPYLSFATNIIILKSTMCKSFFEKNEKNCQKNKKKNKIKKQT
jgi:hypothetical protein